ncbi:MAG: hypothetical protein IAG10_05550 [Planctomycetaceae bacterium]|nr:hypothetical protein [Planctomycetaceae bacterium]
MTVSDKAVRIWDISDPLGLLTPTERILELELRSGTTLHEAQNLRTLTFKEWQAKSPEYQAIQTKLAARKPNKSNPTNRSSEQKPDQVQSIVPPTALGSPK